LQKAAIIGAGYIAREHLDALRSLPGVRIAGICDLSPTLAEATAEEFGADSHWTDHRRMLAELQPDVVHVTTPPKSHVPLALDAIEAGAHVLIEKPIATEPADLVKLMSAARAQGKTIVEDYNYLFSPSVQQILALIESGDFGDVVHVDVHFCVPILGPGSKHADPTSSPFAGLPGGAVVDFITHLAYLAHAFVGAHQTTHTSWRNRSGDPVVPYDEFRALIDAEHGTACIGFSAHAQPDVFSLRVFGTKMRASASLFEPLLSIEKLRGGPPPLLPVMNGLAVAGAHTRSAFYGLYRKLQGKPGTYQGLWLLLEKLYGSIAAGDTPPITPERITAVNALVGALLRDAKQQ
jgi:predicted dehydrogenase